MFKRANSTNYKFNLPFVTIVSVTYLEGTVARNLNPITSKIRIPDINFRPVASIIRILAVIAGNNSDPLGRVNNFFLQNLEKPFLPRPNKSYIMTTQHQTRFIKKQWSFNILHRFFI